MWRCRFYSSHPTGSRGADIYLLDGQSMNKSTKSTENRPIPPFVKFLIKISWAANLGYILVMLASRAGAFPHQNQNKRSVQVSAQSRPTELVEPSFFASASTKEPAPMPNEAQWCLFQYHLTNKNYRLCSINKLSKAQLLVLHNQMVGAKALYEIYVKETYAITVGPPQNNIDIFLIDDERINNERNFKYNPEAGLVVGRYYPKTNWMFLTDRVFTEKGDSDFPHEIAHWLNEDIGIAERDNEPMVRKFEKFYRSTLR